VSLSNGSTASLRSSRLGRIWFNSSSKINLDNLQVLGFLGKRDRRRYLRCVFRGQEMLESVDAQLYRGMVHLAGTKLNPSRFAPAERFESQQAKKIGP